MRLSPFRSTLDSRCSLESTQYRRLLDKSEKIEGEERGNKTREEKEKRRKREREMNGEREVIPREKA